MMIFDIETGALPDTELESIKPQFEAGGNVKDPAKIAAQIAEKEKDWKESAALSAVTGRVLAIGIVENGKFSYCDHKAEENLLDTFWGICHKHTDGIVGFNCNGFDLPFLFRRSWKLGIRPPSFMRKGRYWGDCVVDLMDVWCLGNKEQRASLDTICKHLGIGIKSGKGGDFAKLWESDRPKAVEYLKNDLLLTAKLYDSIFA